MKSENNLVISPNRLTAVVGVRDTAIINLEDVTLYGADFMKTDLTMIKNKSLAGANLSHTSFLLANLSGVNLSDVTLEGTNFLRMDLSGVDFTTTKPLGVIFLYSDLTNSNFEGVSSTPYDSYTRIFENKAHLDPKQDVESGDFNQRKFVVEVFGEVIDNVRVVSTKVSGNDLYVEWFFFNNFAHSNLENANFKNTSMWFAKFSSANLTNADLSGADFRYALFDNADLSNANLQDTDLSGANLTGANLSGATYNDNTIRKCVGHYICVN